MASTNFFIVMLGVGSFAIYLGVSGLLGYRRQEYIFPHYYSGGINYASIPLGTMGIIWAFLAVLKLPIGLSNFFLFISLGIGLLGLLLNFLQPKFMTPQWYRWLEDNHEDILHLLHRDAREMGYNKWKKQTRTQEGLEAWVAEVRQKHGIRIGNLSLEAWADEARRKHGVKKQTPDLPCQIEREVQKRQRRK